MAREYPLREQYPDAWAWAFAGDRPACLQLSSYDLAAELRRRTGAVWNANTLRRIRGELGLDRQRAPVYEEPRVTIDPVSGFVDLTGEPDVLEIAALLRFHDLDPDEWEVVECTINRWTGSRPHDAGLVQHRQMKLRLRKRLQYRILLPAPEPVEFFRPVASPHPPDRPRLILVTTDMQIPFHDEVLHQLSCQFAHDVQIDAWEDLGDYLDLPGLSRWPRKATFYETYEASCHIGGRVLKERTAAAPAWCTKRVRYGNHDQRVDNWLIQHAPEFFGVKRFEVGPEENLPVLAPEYVMNAARFGWEFRANYPYNEGELAPGLVGYHGEDVTAGAGNSVRKELARRNHSLIQGHVNNLAIVSLTRKGVPDDFTVYGIEAGLMCTREGSLGFGRTSKDWTPGFVVITTFPDGRWHPELVFYQNGAITWRDRQWTAKSLV